MEKRIYSELNELEDKHWWFIGKKKIVKSLLFRYLNNPSQNELLDIGCGTGLMLKELQNAGTAHGLDMSDDAIAFCRKKFDGDVKKGSLPSDIPFQKDHFDGILALDVIEHVDDDIAAVRSIKSLLKRSGIAIITVPTFQFLWSSHDTSHHHKRRYTANILKKVILGSGLKIEKISYFNTFLFLPILLIRTIKKMTKSEEPDTKMPNPVINQLFKYLMKMESFLLKFIDLPFGVSIVAVVRKD